MTFAKPEELDYACAYRAYYNMSFDPEKRAKSDQEAFASFLNKAYAEMAKLAQNDAQKALLKIEMSTFKSKYLSLTLACLHAKSCTASPMITGSANFPVARNQKRMQTEQRRLEELATFETKGQERIIKKLLNLRSQEDKDLEEWDTVKKRVEHNHTFRHHGSTALCADYLKRLAANGKINLVKRALLHLEKLPGKSLFTKRHSIYKIMNSVPPTLEEVPTGEKHLFDFEGGKVINNYEADRVQILFDNKPDEGMRSKLKSNGWRWSPRFSAWQRKNTPNGIYSTKNLLK